MADSLVQLRGLHRYTSMEVIVVVCIKVLGVYALHMVCLDKPFRHKRKSEQDEVMHMRCMHSGCEAYRQLTILANDRDHQRRLL